MADCFGGLSTAAQRWPRLLSSGTMCPFFGERLPLNTTQAKVAVPMGQIYEGSKTVPVQKTEACFPLKSIQHKRFLVSVKLIKQPTKGGGCFLGCLFPSIPWCQTTTCLTLTCSKVTWPPNNNRKLSPPSIGKFLYLEWGPYFRAGPASSEETKKPRTPSL